MESKSPLYTGIKMKGERGREDFSTQVTVEGEHPHLSGLGEESNLTAPPFGTTGGKQALPPLPAVFNYVPCSPSSTPGWGVSVFYGQIFDRTRGFTVESTRLHFAVPRTAKKLFCSSPCPPCPHERVGMLRPR